MKSLKNLHVLFVATALALVGAGCGSSPTPTDKPVAESGTIKENKQNKEDAQTRANNKKAAAQSP